jgi:hypothetical protein
LTRPAAADFEHALATMNLQQFDDSIQFGDLRDFMGWSALLNSAGE